MPRAAPVTAASRATDTLQRANALVTNIMTYAGLPVVVYAGFQKYSSSAAQHPVELAAVLIIPLALVLAFHTWPEEKARRRRRELEELGVGGRLVDPGYFRLTPWDNRENFNRADMAHERVLRWLRESRAPLLYLTGYSGTGKSSILQGWVIPKLKNEDAMDVVQVRVFDHPAQAIGTALIEAGRLASGCDLGDLRAFVEQAVKGQPLLLVIDQFEEFLILHGLVEAKELTDWLQSQVARPTPGLKLLLVMRSDYLGALEEYGLPRLEQHKNWEEVPAFTERAALEFIDDSGLHLGSELREEILAEAREVEETPGLIRPITLNLFGMILRQSPDRLPKSHRPGALLRGYLTQLVSRRDIAELSPRVLGLMITEAGTKRPLSVTEMAQALQVDRHRIRGCLIRLGDEGLVRELDPEKGVWEVSHDFVARLLQVVILGGHGERLRRLALRWTPVLALLGWVLVVFQFVPYWQLRQAEKFWRDAGCSLTLAPRSNLEDVTCGDLDDAGLRRIMPSLARFPEKVEGFDVSSDRKLTDFSALSALTAVRKLDLNATAIANLAPLSVLTSLEELSISETPIQDLTPIASLAKLRNLDISDDRSLRSLAPLARLTHMQNLDIGNTATVQLDALSSLVNLQQLRLYDTSVTDLSPIAGLSQLHQITLPKALRGTATVTSLQRQHPGIAVDFR